MNWTAIFLTFPFFISMERLEQRNQSTTCIILRIGFINIINYLQPIPYFPIVKHSIFRSYHHGFYFLDQFKFFQIGFCEFIALETFSEMLEVQNALEGCVKSAVLSIVVETWLFEWFRIFLLCFLGFLSLFCFLVFLL